MEELLKQILAELSGTRKDIAEMKEDISGLKDDVSVLKTDIAGLKDDVTHLKTSHTRLEQKVDGIYQAVVRIEEGRPLDIYAIIGNISDKIDLKDAEIAVLNKRVFKVETDLERINEQ